jgi:hypothetical protein
MAQLREKVMDALRRELSDVVDLLEQTPSGRVTGVVVSRAFDGKSHDDRQQVLSRALEAGLSDDELLELGPIVALTPAEAYVQI